MSPLSCPRPLLLLPVLVLLAASSARADMPNETFYLTREEISDDSLRGVIGIFFLKSQVGPEERLTGHLPLQALEAEGFRPDGTIAVEELRPVSGWDWDLQSVRKFPVVEQRDGHLLVVIDVQKNERAWVSPAQASEHGFLVEYLPLDAPEWAWSGIELYFLAPQAETRLYGAPRLEARSHLLSPLRPPRRQGAVVNDLRIMGANGNFLRVGELLSLDEPLAPVGWVPLTDETGKLLVWPVVAPMC
jgi:hypothetical protein